MTFIQRGQLESILESCRRRAGAHLDLITATETSHHATRKAQSSSQKSSSEKSVIYVRRPGLDSGPTTQSSPSPHCPCPLPPRVMPRLYSRKFPESRCCPKARTTLLGHLHRSWKQAL